MFKTQEFTYTSFQDGLEIKASIMVPSNPKGIVQLVHGMSEHRKRDHAIMKFLAEQGYICVMNDHRGHGESVKCMDDLGYFYERSGTFIVEDVHQLTYYMKTQFPNLPYYLLGHSMGSLVARAYTKKYDYELTGLIVCGSPSSNPAALPALLLVKLLRLFKGDRFRSKLLHKLAFGTYNKSFSESKSENAWICSDEDVVATYDKDPKCGFIFTLNGFENLFRLLRTVYNDDHWILRNAKLPILFIAGKLDPCIQSISKFEEAIMGMKNVGYHNIKHILYNDMRHEILNEKDKEVVFNDVMAFLEEHRYLSNS